MQIQVRYEEMIAAEKLSYDNDENAYATALGSDPSSLLYHPDYDVATEKGYFYVKNILLPFSDEQKALLSSVEATGNYTDEAIEIYRSSLASEILVNVYNVDIGADDEADYFDTELDITLGSVVGGYGVVDDPLTIDIDESIVPDEVNYVYQREDVPLNTIFQEIVTDLNAATTLEDLIKVYEDWTFLVNEDAGAFKGIISDSTDYLVSPEGKSSTYVTEFTDLSRGLFELGVGAYGGVTGAIVDGITIINYNADLTYCVTDYGVHIVLVSEIPFDYAVDKNTNQVTVNDEGMPLKTLDYNVNDEETIRDIIRETLENEYAKTYYSYDRREFFKSSSDSVETYEKIYKELMKEAVKLEELVAGS